jgi:predicted glycogen debranching enzyme
LITLQQTETGTILSLPTTDKSLDELLQKEWLLTNGRGGYASSTVVGCNTSSYHALLVGSLNPPVNRVMALSNCLEMVISKGPGAYETLSAPNAEQVLNLSTFEFADKFAPLGFTGIRNFRRDAGVHFDYEFENCRLTKSVYLARNCDTVIVEYDFKQVSRTSEFVIRPFVGLRDFHGLQKSYATLASECEDEGVAVRQQTPDSCELFLKCPCSTFEKDEQWWFNFVYRVNKERGQGCTEDLWTPGFFRIDLTEPKRIVFLANLNSGLRDARPSDIDADSLRNELTAHHRSIISSAKKDSDRKLKALCLAADQFITKRTKKKDSGVTVLAGYPWFADWGRDAFIALPGLLLETERFEEAKTVLITFAARADEGMIPNRFDDRDDITHFNSVDASLWFINASFQYLNATGDSHTFAQYLLPVIRWVIDSYEKGTRFDIHADTDGLISAGGSETQLTWMDARHDHKAFTPRYGKPVEVNALWHNALCLLARFYAGRNEENARRYKAMAETAGESFRSLFWNDRRQCLNDCILPDRSIDSSLRPNQIFAVSLPYSPLMLHEQKGVVAAVAAELLTPFGLRTLSRDDKNYRGICTGTPRQRDEAYHQGTVWAFLMGPFIEAYLKVNGFSKKSRKTALEFIEPLLEHLTEDACLGSVSEIFDGDAPHTPRGCIAQAWSVAELLRAYKLINS